MAKLAVLAVIVVVVLLPFAASRPGKRSHKSKRDKIVILRDQNSGSNEVQKDDSSSEEQNQMMAHFADMPDTLQMAVLSKEEMKAALQKDGAVKEIKEDFEVLNKDFKMMLDEIDKMLAAGGMLRDENGQVTLNPAYEKLELELLFTFIGLVKAMDSIPAMVRQRDQLHFVDQCLTDYSNVAWSDMKIVDMINKFMDLAFRCVKLGTGPLISSTDLSKVSDADITDVDKFMVRLTVIQGVIQEFDHAIRFVEELSMLIFTGKPDDAKKIIQCYLTNLDKSLEEKSDCRPPPSTTPPPPPPSTTPPPPPPSTTQPPANKRKRLLLALRQLLSKVSKHE